MIWGPPKMGTPVHIFPGEWEPGSPYYLELYVDGGAPTLAGTYLDYVVICMSFLLDYKKSLIAINQCTSGERII